MHKIDSVLIVDSDEMDNFVNRKILEHHGVSNIIIFNKHFNAFDFLKTSNLIFQYVIVGSTNQAQIGFDFINKFIELELAKMHGEIIILSVSINSSDKLKEKSRNVRFLEKPLTVKKMFNYKSIN